MTDYASQGKSRALNVVDLTNCRDHRAYYVALSRGTSAAGTIILQNFDEKKITSGMSGYLRQELRELELLDEITRLRFCGLLPRSVTGVYRRKLLRSYLLWKGSSEDPSHFHPSMRWNEKIGPRIPEPMEYDTWIPSVDRSAKRKGTEGSAAVSEVTGNKKSKVAPLRPPRPDTITPLGLVWDSVNYSCGYDAMFTVLAGIWSEDRSRWTQRF
ncbi:hypothetical protein B0H16DRAFT_1275161, partial [Mycena metata]